MPAPTHLRFPLMVSSTGRLAAVQVDSVDDVGQSLALLAATRPGERLSVPAYGTPPFLFTDEPPVEALREAAAMWEPRAAGYSVDVSGDLQAPTVTITGELP
jgi:phage baseplate assembly protein W